MAGMTPTGPAEVASEVAFEAGESSISGLWNPASDPAAVAVIAHGAGGTMRHAYLQGAVDGLVSRRVSALRFNFPYAAAGRRYPDPPRVLMAAWRGALAAAQSLGDGLPAAATGKSLGGRMASMVAAEDGDAFSGRALVFFGYPLHAPGRTEQLREAHLASITVPMLFIEGTQDAFARLDLIQSTVERLGPRAQLHLIDGGDHSHRVRGAKRPDREIGAELGQVAATFILEVT
jgi:predicted alpha/beta-hydrolase family hydrolase